MSQVKIDDFDDNTEAERIMNRYRKLGFVQNDDDAMHLHMSFSPFKVPKDLTKLQIRRRINKRKNNPINNENGWLKEILSTNCLEILINGKRILHSSFKGEEPANHRQLKKLIKEIMGFNSKV